jgi:hypothetical protein
MLQLAPKFYVRHVLARLLIRRAFERCLLSSYIVNYLAGAYSVPCCSHPPALLTG